MRLGRGKRAISAQIPTASMADIAFLLIVFFMITTKFQVDKQTVQLPETVLRTEILADSPFISIARAGAGNQSVAAVKGCEVRFSDGVLISKPVLDLDDLTARIATKVAENSEYSFIIKADEMVTYEVFDLVREALKDAGARNVVFLSKQKVDSR